MKSVVVYCSKTGNTHKVAQAIAEGVEGRVELIRLHLTPEGIMRKWSNTFTFDLIEYDLIFLGCWIAVMKIHPYLVSYIKRCKHIEGKRVYGFITAGAIFSVGHGRENMEKILNERNIQMLGFFSAATLLGPALTKAKLAKAKAFGQRASQEAKKAACEKIYDRVIMTGHQPILLKR